jgi:hypothetical protein
VALDDGIGLPLQLSGVEAGPTLREQEVKHVAVEDDRAVACLLDHPVQELFERLVCAEKPLPWFIG